MGGVETLVLVRHGATSWNASGYCQGHKDVPLSEAGARQIELLREQLSRFEFDRAYASPLIRAQQTCEGIGYEPASEEKSWRRTRLAVGLVRCSPAE